MWQQEYLESLPLDAMDEVGLLTQLHSVSVALNDMKKWDHSFAKSIISSVPTMLEILEHTGFFFLLKKLVILHEELHTSGLLLQSPEAWKQLPPGGSKIVVPVSRMLCQLNPRKIRHGFLVLWNFREEVKDDDWEGLNCLRHLAVVQQGLEDLDPWRTLNCFEALHDFLTFQYPSLISLVAHSEAHENLACLNFFPMLVLAKKIMETRMEYYNECLVDLQEVLEDLNEVEAIVLSPEDLDMY